MAFDQATRNRLLRLTTEVRALLVEEFTRQLQNDYGMDPASGLVTPLERLGHLDDARFATARILRETLTHYQATQKAVGSEDSVPELLDRILREQAFTVLNRLAALRMAEARGLAMESLGAGYQSKGFRLYVMLAGAGLGETGQAYRAYLFSVFDELALDLPLLFDRFSPQGRLFPGEGVLLALLDKLNHPEIAPLWAEDETLGWIYQYFNSREERKQMRDASAAPRTSRELAVRNQFFTPRYVVEFLTDNTLGRLWVEMTRGQTRLKDQCRYLLTQPGEDLPSRPRKDPRELRVLDPACGSMHFGLYAFDLLETIYEEAWDLAPAPAAGQEPAPLREAYADKAAYLRDVPRLIVERNLHGVDIDPRAAQIAALALWLRAHKSWQARGIRAADRPRISRSNVVCAEPMPAERELRDRLFGELSPQHAEIARGLFENLRLAGLAGSLLKPEAELAAALKRTLGGGGSDLLTQDTADRWQKAEAAVLEALRAMAEGAGGQGERLFAQDAARGFGLIDLCRRRYDVVLMNPPFGEAARDAKDYIAKAYPRTRNDLYAAFVERGLELLHPHGRLGAITSRTGFFLTSFRKWREDILLREARPQVVVDLGHGVLDTAMVETAAYVLEKT